MNEVITFTSEAYRDILTQLHNGHTKMTNSEIADMATEQMEMITIMYTIEDNTPELNVAYNGLNVLYKALLRAVPVTIH